MKTCAKCKKEKPLEEFHKQPSGKFGRHSYCRLCANEVQRCSRVRNYSKESKRKWQIKSRYGLSASQVKELLAEQHGVCAICKKEMSRMCIDHCHETGVVRGLLCHRCNICLGGWDDLAWRNAAEKYLELTR